MNGSNKLSIHLRENKTESIFFRRENKTNLSLTITEIKNVIKQESVVEYLVCLLDENMAGEARMIYKKDNAKKFSL